MYARYPLQEYKYTYNKKGNTINSRYIKLGYGEITAYIEVN